MHYRLSTKLIVVAMSLALALGYTAVLLRAGPCGSDCIFAMVEDGYGGTGTCAKIVSGGGSMDCGWLGTDPTPCSGTFTSMPQDGLCGGPDGDACNYGENSNQTINKTGYTVNRRCDKKLIKNEFGVIIDVECECVFPIVGTFPLPVKKCLACEYGS